MLTAKVPTPLPLSAEKTLAPKRYRSFRTGTNEIGTSTGRVDEGAIGSTGRGIGSRTLALQPWLPVLGAIVKPFSSVCVVALLANVTCRKRRPGGSGFVGSRRNHGVPTIGATVMLSSPGANPPAFGLL
ncbi:MAG TPA: hypothetical protein VN828_12340, partial [Acidobacteriaceae bacterium]|nr:hypothetical protein [Acidobacteriaceae bacterium]